MDFIEERKTEILYSPIDYYLDQLAFLSLYDPDAQNSEPNRAGKSIAMPRLESCVIY